MSKAKNKSKSKAKKSHKKDVSTSTKVEKTTKELRGEAKQENLKPIEKSAVAKSPAQTDSLWQDPDFRKKFVAVFWGVLGVVAVVLVMFIGFPKLFDQTEAAQDYKVEKEEQERVRTEKEKLQDQLEEETPEIAGTNRQVKLATNFGDIVIETQTEAAPRTVENFLRLAHRGYFDGTVFHRMVKQENFAVIQGGDPTATGTGGESAFGPGETIPDELWAVEPEFETSEEGVTELSNEPKLQGDGLYGELSVDEGTVIYPKGTIAMAKTAQPDSATSQFFIMLQDTTLPAQYTIFGKIIKEDIEVLDKIYEQVEPAVEPNVDGTTPENGGDGKPSQEIKIEKAELL